MMRPLLDKQRFFALVLLLLAGCSDDTPPAEPQPEPGAAATDGASPPQPAPVADKPDSHPDPQPTPTPNVDAGPDHVAKPPVKITIAEPVVKGHAVSASVRGDLQSNYLVSSVDWSADGAMLLTSGQQIELWDLKTGKISQQFGPGASAMFTAGQKNIVAIVEQSLVVWNAEDGKKLHTLPLPDELFESEPVKLSVGGDGVLATSENAAVVVDVQQATVQNVDLKALDVKLNSATISKDGATIAFGGKYGMVTLVNASTLKALKAFESYKNYSVISIVIAPGGNQISLASSAAKISSWDVKTGEKLAEANTETSFYEGSLCYSPGGGIIASLGSYFTFFNATDLASLRANYSGYKYRSAAFSPDGRRLATVVNGDNFARIFDLHAGPAPFALPETIRPNALYPLPGNGNAVSLNRHKRNCLIADGKPRVEFGDEEFEPGGAVVAPDGKTFVCYGESLTWWKVDDGARIREVEGDFLAAAFHASSPHLLATEDSSVWEFDAASGARGREFITEAGALYAVAVSPDGQWIAAGGQGAETYLFDYKSGELKHRVITQQGPVTGLRFSPDSQWLACTGEDDNAVALWKMGEEKPQILPHTSSLPTRGSVKVVDAIFTPENKRLITATSNGELHIWDVATAKRTGGRLVPPLTSLHPTPDGAGLLTLQRGNPVAGVWEFDKLIPLPEGEAEPQPKPIQHQQTTRYFGQLAEFKGSRYSLQAVAVSPDESLAATFENDGVVFVWDLNAIRHHHDADIKHAQRAFGPAADRGRFVKRQYSVEGFQYAHGIYFSQDGKRLFLHGGTYTDGKVALLDIASGEIIKTAKLPSQHNQGAIDPRSGLVAIGSDGAVASEVVNRFDVNNLDPQQGIPFKNCHALAFEKKGSRLLVATGGAVAVFDMNTGEKQRDIPIKGKPLAIAVSPDGARMTVAEDLRQLRCYDFATGKPLWSTNLQSVCKRIGYTPDGRFVLVDDASRSGLYDASSGEIVRLRWSNFYDKQYLKDSQTAVTVGSRFCVVSLPDFSSSKVQDEVAKLGPGVKLRRSNQHLLLKVDVYGRHSRQQLADLQNVLLPLKLDLSESSFLDFAALKLLQGNSHIYGLSLPSMELSADDLAVLKSLPNLAELAVETCSEAVLQALPEMKSLRILTMQSNAVYEENGFAVLAKCPQLEVVHLTLDSDNAVAAIKALPALKHLREVKIVWDELSASSIRFLGSKLPALKTLSIECDNLNEKAVALAALKGVQELTLAGDLSGESLQHLEALPLTGLDISATEVTDNAASIAAIKTLRWCSVPLSDDGELAGSLQEAAPTVNVFEPLEE